MTPQSEANRLFPILLSRAKAMEDQYGKPEIIPISIYETDNDLEVLRPEDKGIWTAKFHRETMEIIASKLQAEGYNAVSKPLDAAAYLRWLAETKNKNTPENRAQFIQLQF